MRGCVLAAVLLCGAMGVAQAAPPTAANGAAAANGVSVAAVVPFAEGATIAGAVRRECRLGEKLSGFIKEYAQDNGVEVSLVPQVAATDPGRVLVVEITDSLAAGNAFIGHHTYTTIKGRLYQDGAETGNFIGRRNSMGGAFAGFKGNCSVLGRTVKALGEDVAGWLLHPAKDAQLGDLE